MRTQIHPKRMKSLGLQEQLRNETHRKQLNEGKKIGIKRKPLRKEMQKHQKKGKIRDR
jgi:hypothetical protein